MGRFAEEDGPIRDCHHPYAKHVHGTTRAYDQDRCRCRPCRDAMKQARRDSRSQANGRLVDADPVLARAKELAELVGVAELSRMSGLPKATVHSLLVKKRRRWTVNVETANAIMAVDPKQATAVKAASLTWKLRALTRIGWSSEIIGRSAGLPSNTVRSWVHDGIDMLPVERVDAIEKVYRELKKELRTGDGDPSQLSASERLTNKAVVLGWPTPAELESNWDRWRSTPVSTQVPARPSTWRLRALMSVGWPVRLMAADLGCAPKVVEGLLKGSITEMGPGFEARVDDLYRRGWRRAPDDPVAGAVRANARRRGWPMPMDIDDDRLRSDPRYVPRRSKTV